MNIVSIGHTHLSTNDYQLIFSQDKVSQIDMPELDSLVITRKTCIIASPGSDEEMSVIYSKVRKSDWATPILFFTARPDRVSSFIECDKNSFCFSLDVKAQKIKETLSSISEEGEACLEYIRVPIRSFYSLNTTPVDLFIKLSAAKTLKIVNKDCESLNDTLNKFIEKKCDYVYVKNDEYYKLVEFMGENNHSPLWDSMDSTTKSMFARETFDFVHTSLHAIGLDEKTFRLTNKLMLSSSHFIKSNKNKEFKEVWSSVVTGKNYLVEHSLLLAYLTVGAQQHFECKSLDKAQKLLISSMFHDISLTSDKIAKNFGTELQEEEYDDYLIEEFDSHHKDAVALLASMSGISSDVDTILMQHHEKPDGTGFPRGLSGSQIHPLSCLFIVVHDFVQVMYQRGFTLYHRNEVISQMRDKYSEGFFVESLAALESLFGFGQAAEHLNNQKLVS